MNVLVVTNMYPSELNDRDVKGIFVKEQVVALSKSNKIESVEVVNIDDGGVLYKYVFSAVRILKFYLKNRPDVIHVHYGLTFFPLVLIYPFISRAKIVVTFHGTDLMGGKPLVYFVSRLAAMLSDICIVVSEEMRNVLRKSEKVFVIPCSIDDRFFKATRSIEDIKNILVFPSNPDRPEKNYQYFINVCQIVKKAGGNFRVVTLKELSRNNVLDVFREATALLLTSDREGSPQVVKEALAIGLPVISRKVGDVTSLIGRVDGLYLVDNEREMAEKTLEILQEDNLKVVQNSCARALFGEQAVVEKLVSLYC